MKTPIISVERVQALTHHSGDSHFSERRDQIVRVFYGALSTGWLSRIDSGAYRALLLMLLKAETLDMQKLAVFQKYDLLRDDGVGRLFSLTTDVGLSRDLGSGLNTAKRALQILHSARLIETWRIPSGAQSDFGKVGLWGNEVHVIRGDGDIAVASAPTERGISVWFTTSAIPDLIYKRQGNSLKLVTAIALHARPLRALDERLFRAYPEILRGGDLEERIFCFTTDEGLSDECGFYRKNLRRLAHGLPFIENWEIPSRARQEFRNQLRFNGTRIFAMLKNRSLIKTLGHGTSDAMAAQIPVDAISDAWARIHPDVPLTINSHQQLSGWIAEYDTAARTHGDTGESWLLAAIEKSGQTIRRNEQSIINYVATCLKDWQQNGPRFRAVTTSSPSPGKQGSRKKGDAKRKKGGVADELAL